jgi:hypothetical protein
MEPVRAPIDGQPTTAVARQSTLLSTTAQCRWEKGKRDGGEGRGESKGRTCFTNWSETQQRRRKKKASPMATTAPDLGKTTLAHYRDEERRNGGGDGMF